MSEHEPATVTAVTPSLTIRYDTGVKDLPARRAGSYTPVVADRVAVVVYGAEILVVCKVL